MAKSFLYAVKVFYTISKKPVIMFFICNIVEAPLLLGELFYTRYFIDTIQNSGKNFDVNHIFINMVILISIIYVSGIISGSNALCQTRIGEISLFEKERLIIEKTIKLSLTDLDSPDTKTHREKAMRLQLDTLLNEWVFFFRDVLKTILLMTILLYYKLYILVFIIAALAVLQLIVNKYAADKVETISREQTSLKRLANYLFSLLADREYIHEITILKISTYLKNKLSFIFNKNLKQMQKGLLRTETVKAVLSLFFAAVNITVVIVLVLTVSGDIKSAGQFVILYQIVNNLFSLVSSLSTHYNSLTQCIIQYNDFFIFRQKEEETLCSGGSYADGKGLEIHIDNLYFSYPDSHDNALNGVNLHIKSGERVAFVGDNGSGKSTLIKVIMGLYTPSSGTVRWYLEDRNIPSNAIRGRTRIVFQDFAKLLRPIRENVALGDISKLNKDPDLLYALNMAGVYDYSKDLNSLIGPEFGGVDMSGGQWQKIAIARAYIGRGSLLIYDEATSALDPDSELKAFKSFLSLGHNKTSIIVTHRLSMTKFVDKIAVIEKGRVIEYGPHNELLKKGSAYAKMYNAQSAIYTT